MISEARFPLYDVVKDFAQYASTYVLKLGQMS